MKSRNELFKLTKILGILCVKCLVIGFVISGGLLLAVNCTESTISPAAKSIQEAIDKHDAAINTSQVDYDSIVDGGTSEDQ